MVFIYIKLIGKAYFLQLLSSMAAPISEIPIKRTPTPEQIAQSQAQAQQRKAEKEKATAQKELDMEKARVLAGPDASE